MEMPEILNRMELLYPDVEKITLLRRAYVDEDISSLYKLVDADKDLRNSIDNDDLRALFRSVPGASSPENETLRKAVVEKDIANILKLLEPHISVDYKQAVLGHNMHSIMRVCEVDDDIRKAVLEQNLFSVFRLFTTLTNPQVELLRKATMNNHVSSLMDLITDDEDLRKSIVNHNLHSIFRVAGQKDSDLYRAVASDNKRAIFKLLDLDQNYITAILKKDFRSICAHVTGDTPLFDAVVKKNALSVFAMLEEYTDGSQYVNVFKRILRQQVQLDEDSFSQGQLKSKRWMASELGKHVSEIDCLYICAGWYAVAVPAILESGITVGRIRSFDVDDSCADIAEIVNKPTVIDGWKFRAVTKDIMDINYADHEYVLLNQSGTEIQQKDSPDCIINTSCEHLPDFAAWYDLIPEGTLVVLQANDFDDVETHVNTMDTIDGFVEQTPLTKELYSGELDTGLYTRYMRIGFK